MRKAEEREAVLQGSLHSAAVQLQATRNELAQLASEHGRKHDDLVAFQRLLDAEVGRLEGTLQTQRASHDVERQLSSAHAATLQASHETTMSELNVAHTRLRALEQALREAKAAAEAQTTALRASHAADLRALEQQAATLAAAHADAVAQLQARIQTLLGDVQAERDRTRLTAEGLAARTTELAAAHRSHAEERESMSAALKREMSDQLYVLEQERSERQRLQDSYDARVTRLSRDLDKYTASLAAADSRELHLRTTAQAADAIHHKLTTDLAVQASEARDEHARQLDALRLDHAREIKALLGDKTAAMQRLAQAQQRLAGLQATVDQLLVQVVALEPSPSLPSSPVPMAVSRGSSATSTAAPLLEDQMLVVAAQHRSLTAALEEARTQAADLQRTNTSLVQQQAETLAATAARAEERLNALVADLSRQLNESERKSAKLATQIHDDADKWEARERQADIAARQHAAALTDCATEAECRDKLHAQEIARLKAELAAVRAELDALNAQARDQYLRALRAGVTLRAPINEAAPTTAARQIDFLADQLEARAAAVVAAEATTRETQALATSLRSQVEVRTMELGSADEQLRTSTEDAQAQRALLTLEQARATDLVTSLREGFERERTQFADQIALARGEALQGAADVAELRRTVHALERDVDRAVTEQRATRESLQGAEKQAERLQSHCGESDARVATLQGELTRLSSSLARVEAEGRAETSQRKAVESRAADLAAQSQRAHKDLQDARATNATLSAAHEATVAAKTDALVRVAQLERDKAALQASLQSLAAENKEREEAQQREVIAAKETARRLGELQVANASLLRDRAAEESARTQLVTVRAALDAEQAGHAQERLAAHQQVVVLQAQVDRERRQAELAGADLSRQLSSAQSRLDRELQSVLFTAHPRPLIGISPAPHPCRRAGRLAL